MSELAFLFVRTESILDKFLAQLTLFLILLLALVFVIEGNPLEVIVIVARRFGLGGAGRGEGLFGETLGVELEGGVFLDEESACGCH